MVVEILCGVIIWIWFIKIVGIFSNVISWCGGNCKFEIYDDYSGDFVCSVVVIVVVMDFEFMIFFVLVDYIVEDVCSFDGLSLDDGFVWDFGS